MSRMPFAVRPRFPWRLRSRELALGERTRLMAIVNLTPDSFSGDGLSDRGLGNAVEAACRMIDGGADIVDLGAESTRPGAQPVSTDEEQARLLPVLDAVCRERPGALLSVDSYHAATARAAARAGAEIVNDVSGLQWDAAMAQAVSETGCGLVLMHARGRPTEWHALPTLSREKMLQVVFAGLMEGLAVAEAAGIPSDAIVLDPGFGFGKHGAENFALLAELDQLHQLGRALLVGLSRKGFLGAAVRDVQRELAAEIPASVARLNATLAGNVAAILAGAHVLRVHDLQAAQEAAAVADEVLAAAAASDAAS